MQSLLGIMKNILNFAPETKTRKAMNNKSILMPHACQKIGLWFLLLSALLAITKIIITCTAHNIDVAWYLAKASHIVFILSLFLITLSKEKVEDEMIYVLRLKALGITGYAFFVVFLLLSLILGLNGTQNPYLSEIFLLILPILMTGLYYIIFRGLLWRSQKEQAV